MSVAYVHVDVFAEAPYRGNSLPVFLEPPPLTSGQMLQLTQELRHFEAIFLTGTMEPSTWRARVFDLFGELAFAGHPIIGAAAVLHDRAAASGAIGDASSSRTWRIELPAKVVTVVTQPTPDGYVSELDQGEPEFGAVVDDRDTLSRVARAFDLEPVDLRDGLPVQVVSTGLRYLIVPVVEGALERARVVQELTALVRSAGAEFAVLFDEARVEVRHWNNDGVLEDVATGSAAGSVGAYRLRHGLTPAGEAFALNQGRFTGRPSILSVRPQGSSSHVERVIVGGAVAFVGSGTVEVPRQSDFAPLPDEQATGQPIRLSVREGPAA